MRLTPTISSLLMTPVLVAGAAFSSACTRAPESRAEVDAPVAASTSAGDSGAAPLDAPTARTTFFPSCPREREDAAAHPAECREDADCACGVDTARQCFTASGPRSHVDTSLGQTPDRCGPGDGRRPACHDERCVVRARGRDGGVAWYY